MAENPQNDDRTQAFTVLSPGARVAHYTIVEKIGEGGMGEVYLADDSRLRRQVALKFLPRQFTQNAEFSDRFRREARAAAALNHPSIITVHDIAEHQGQPYIVMEYYESVSLKKRVQDRSLSGTDILSIAIQVADGLHRAHSSGIVHRDIKSENILVDSVNHVKITDFGLAKVETAPGLTQAGTAMGTVAYMSPEQARGESVDSRSDLFSLGVVLYELISGNLPFAGSNLAATVNAIINEEPRPLTEITEEVPWNLDEIVTRLLQKDPARRYQTAADVLKDLRELAEGQSILSGTRRPERKRRRPVLPIVIGVIVVAALAIWKLLPSNAPNSDGSRAKMVAVLPFENLGQTSDQYFATGITDEITTHLTKLSGLGVISRSSAAQYAGGGKPLREIGKELGADYVLEGSVRWAGPGAQQRVRITTTLKKVPDEVSVWAESYDQILDDIFTVQSDIAAQVAGAMNVTLLDVERRSIDSRPTADMTAYTFFLQGKDYFDREEWQLAEQMLNRAIASDSVFALAWSLLSRTHSLMYWWYLDRSDERLAQARRAAETSVRLDPYSAETHLAMGRYHYRGHLDYDSALLEYERALELQPNNSDVMFAIGSVKRRQGAWSEAIDLFQRSITLDPRSATKLTNLAETLFMIRHFDDALETVRRLRDLMPDDIGAVVFEARVLACGFGDLEAAARLLPDWIPKDAALTAIDDWLTVSFMLPQADHLLPALQRALDGATSPGDSAFFLLQIGQSHRYHEDSVRAFNYIDRARILLRELVEAWPTDETYRSMYAVALAQSGHTQEAIAEGRYATELCPVSKDALSGAGWRQNLAIVYCSVGEIGRALSEIDYLLSVPSHITVKYLQLHPAFTSLRDDTRFQSILLKWDNAPAP